MIRASIAAGAAPAFLTKNYLDRFSQANSDLVVSSGDSLKHRLYDFDRDAVWSSLGSSDAVTETITAGLYEGALQTSREINFIGLFGVNLKNFLLEYSNNNGSSWTAVTGGDYRVGTADFAGTDLVLSLAAAITANKFRITMYRTQTANEEKEVGHVVLAAGQYQPTKNARVFRPRFTDLRRDIQMADGSVDSSHILRSDIRSDFWRCAFEFVGLAAADRTALLTLKRQTAPFVLYPEPGDLVTEIYLCRVTPGSYEDSYTFMRSASSVRNIRLEVQEIGGS